MNFTKASAAVHTREERVKASFALMLEGVDPANFSFTACDSIPAKRWVFLDMQNSFIMFLTGILLYSQRTFSSAAPRLWNGLPDEICQLDSFRAFKKAIKADLFRQTYPIEF